jgi:integrase
MKGVFQRKDRNPKDWWISYVEPSGRRVKLKIGQSKKLAESALQKIKVEIAEGKYLDIKSNERITFDDFADEYHKLHCVPLKSCKKSHEVHLRLLRTYFKGKYLDEIDVVNVERFKATRMKEVSPATVNRALSCLKSIFNKAIAWGRYNGINPVCKVKMFHEDNKRLRYLEKEEITRLLSVCEGHLKPIVIVALNTGMRLGEILNLKWHDVDFRRDIIYLLTTKNSDDRKIPMNSNVKSALIAVRKNPDSPYIFCNKDGKPFTSVKKSFFTALKNSGIKDFRFHDLRHSAASHLVMSGVDLNTVRELLGHKSLDMTLRYAHLSPDHKRRAIDLLGSVVNEGLKEKEHISVPTASPARIVESEEESEVLVSALQ